ncbi:MAG: hypothetical protein IPM54_17595 [Polyangiaceae bacterium]|nr:hypothetical protein [Polyangiaceae bacterium]
MRGSRAAAKELGARMTGGANQMELWEDNPFRKPLKIRAGSCSPRTQSISAMCGSDGRSGRHCNWICCARRMPEGKESVAWSTMAAVLVIARLCEPSSELHIAEDWYRKTALEDILDLPVERVNDDRLYRALDELFCRTKKLHRETFAQATRRIVLD